MKKKICLMTTLLAIATIGLIFAASFQPVDPGYRAAAYLRRLGWKVDSVPVETVEVEIPRKFDEVYERYNELQKEAGFDLGEYKGLKCTRYTFEVKNFDGAEDVRANLLVFDGKIIGGDIMTTAIDGFMIPLGKR